MFKFCYYEKEIVSFALFFKEQTLICVDFVEKNYGCEIFSVKRVLLSSILYRIKKLEVLCLPLS